MDCICIRTNTSKKTHLNVYACCSRMYLYGANSIWLRITPTSTIDKSESTNDRQRKNENIGVLTMLTVLAVLSVYDTMSHVYEAKQQAIHKCRSHKYLNGNDIVSLT